MKTYERVVNKKMLRKWVALNSVGELMVGAKISDSMVRKLMSEKSDYVPSESAMHRICNTTGFSIDELFPYLSKVNKAA